jgi:hypothetical protein
MDTPTRPTRPCRKLGWNPKDKMIEDKIIQGAILKKISQRIETTQRMKLRVRHYSNGLLKAKIKTKKFSVFIIKLFSI